MNSQSSIFGDGQPEVIVKKPNLDRPLSSPEFFQNMLTNSGPALRASRKISNLQLVVLSFVVICFTLGGYFTYVGLKTLNVTNLQSTSFSEGAIKNTAGSSSTTAPAVSSAPISASTLASYSVAPSLPRYLIIPKLKVDARILSVGITSNGEVGTPYDVFDTAWYNGSSLPGRPGAMLIDGHVSSWSAKGVFYNLKTLVAGDTIQVERGDGMIITYRVVSSQVYPANDVNMKAALSPVVSGQPGLNLVTCTGDVIPGTSEFSERIVVYSEQL